MSFSDDEPRWREGSGRVKRPRIARFERKGRGDRHGGNADETRRPRHPAKLPCLSDKTLPSGHGPLQHAGTMIPPCARTPIAASFPGFDQTYSAGSWQPCLRRQGGGVEGRPGPIPTSSRSPPVPPSRRPARPLPAPRLPRRDPPARSRPGSDDKRTSRGVRPACRYRGGVNRNSSHCPFCVLPCSWNCAMSWMCDAVT